MPENVFVSYRRDDARDMAARIRDRLASTLGEANVFMDVDKLMPGQRFDKELEKALNETDVFLAVIGPRWLTLLAERRASGEHDYVRKEIAEALQRDIIVIPVLIEQTPLPRADALPEDIRNLVLHQTHQVAYARFGRDVTDLIEAIRLGCRGTRAGVGDRSSAVRWVGAAAFAVLMLVGVALAYRMGATDQVPEVKRQEELAAKIEADAVEKARQEQIKQAAEVVAKKQAEDEARARRAEEIERKRLTMLKEEEDRKRATDAEKKAVEELARATRVARNSTWESGISLKFQQYFEPFKRLDSALACRDICLQDERCTGWTYYDSSVLLPKTHERLKRACIVGAGIVSKTKQPGRTSGEVRLGPKAASD